MKIIYTLLLVLLFSCNDFIDTWDAYTIKEGKHSSTREGIPHILSPLTDGRHLKFMAKFTNSCLYEAKDDDISKLYGFCDANSLVHDNSIRFGWRHTNNTSTIEIFAYWYSSGVRGFYKLGETVPYKEDTYEIWARNSTYYFKFNDTEYTTVRTVDAEHGIRTRLFPYFGGNLSAPNDIVIFIYEYN